MIVNYDSRVKPDIEITTYFDPRVVIYECKMFKRLATGLRALYNQRKSLHYLITTPPQFRYILSKQQKHFFGMKQVSTNLKVLSFV